MFFAGDSVTATLVVSSGFSSCSLDNEFSVCILISCAVTKVFISSIDFYFSDLRLITFDLVVLLAFHLIYSNVVIPFLWSIIWNGIKWPKKSRDAKLNTIAIPITILNSRTSAVLKNLLWASSKGSCSRKRWNKTAKFVRLCKRLDKNTITISLKK